MRRYLAARLDEYKTNPQLATQLFYKGGKFKPDGLPENPLPAELADYGISLLGDSDAPAWSSLRHYDSHMIDALRGRGFNVLLTQLLLVRELAVRVPKPVREKGLVPSFG